MKKTLTLALFIISITCLSAQSLTSIYPTSGHEGDVALSEQIDGYGVNFSQGTSYRITIHLGSNSITGYNVHVATSSRLTVSFDIPLNFPEGTYYVTLAGGADSFTTLNPTYVVYAPAASGIDDIEASAISAYPVPARERLYVKPPTGVPIQRVSIISFSGQIMVEQTATGNGEECINLHNLAAGAYILSVTASNGVTMRKKILVD